MEKNLGDGILNSLTNKFILPSIVLGLVSLSCTAQPNNKLSTCVESALKVKVARVDDENHRVFIVGKEVNSDDIKNNLSSLNKCFLNTSWKADWSLSLFTDAKFAGYKDEKSIIPYHKNNQWAKSYILEFDNSEKTMIKNPAVSPSRRTIQ